MTEEHLFVSPLSVGCEQRFSYNLQGMIKPTDGKDDAAGTTIKALALDHEMLTDLRKAAIDGTLELHESGPASLSLAKARNRLSGLERSEKSGGPLEAFCFALKQALVRHIKRLEGIRESKKRGRHR